VHAHARQSIEKYHRTGGTDIILTAFRHQEFYAHNTRGRIIILYILSFVFLDSMQENERCWSDGTKH